MLCVSGSVLAAERFTLLLTSAAYVAAIQTFRIRFEVFISASGNRVYSAWCDYHSLGFTFRVNIFSSCLQKPIPLNLIFSLCFFKILIPKP